MNHFPKCTRTPVIIKTTQKIIKRYTSFSEKGQAEENIYMMKQTQEELLRLRKRILEDEKYLQEKLKQAEKIIKEMERLQRFEAFKKALKEANKKKK